MHPFSAEALSQFQAYAALGPRIAMSVQVLKTSYPEWDVLLHAQPANPLTLHRVFPFLRSFLLLKRTLYSRAELEFGIQIQEL